MATIRKRITGWQVQVRRASHPPISKTFRLKADAEAWARRKESEIDGQSGSGDLIYLRELRVRHLLEKYLEEVTPSKKSQAQEIGIIRQLLREDFADQPILKLTPAKLSAFRDRRLRQVKPATVVRQLAVLQNAFNVAIRDWGWALKSNPVESIRKPRVINRRDRRLVADEYERLVSICEKTCTPNFKELVILAVETGMRRGELLSVLWGDVAWEARTLRVRKSKSGYPRTIPLTLTAVAILSSFKKDDGQIFEVSENAARLAWGRVVKRAGIKNLRFHDLRHEAISRFFEMGLSVPEVALISGHRDYRMLMRYTHLRAEVVGKRLEAAEASKPSFIKIRNREIVSDVEVASAMLERASGNFVALEAVDISRRRVNDVVYRAVVDDLMNERFGVSTTRADNALIAIGAKNRIPPNEFVEVLREKYRLEELN